MDVLGDHGAMPWILFNVGLAIALTIDFGLVSGRRHSMGIKEAVAWNVAWIALAVAFTFVIGYLYGRRPATEYLTGYVVERALSMDNIFVFVVVFKYFGVDAGRQVRVLRWGIIGALVMRAVFILAGAALVSRFHWLMPLFGAFLLYTGVMLFLKDDDAKPDPGKNLIVRLVGKILPLDAASDGDRFFVKSGGRWHGTTLFVVLLVIETTDFIFALDSLPAILGITRDPFILYTSNAFAIVGMRVLYFLLAAILPKFRFLNYGLSLILVFIGVRMLGERWIHISTEVTLLAVVGVLVLSVIASIAIPKR